MEYLKANNSIAGNVFEYVDDGYTGTNFDRPGFIRMIEDAKKGVIKVIVVKDLSRLGRDYIAVGDYIEQIFPMLVYDTERVEIVLNNEDVIRGIIDRIQEKAGKR